MAPRRQPAPARQQLQGRAAAAALVAQGSVDPGPQPSLRCARLLRLVVYGLKKLQGLPDLSSLHPWGTLVKRVSSILHVVLRILSSSFSMSFSGRLKTPRLRHGSRAANGKRNDTNNSALCTKPN